jgi:hypothetical protein
MIRFVVSDVEFAHDDDEEGVPEGLVVVRVRGRFRGPNTSFKPHH